MEESHSLLRYLAKLSEERDYNGIEDRLLPNVEDILHEPSVGVYLAIAWLHLRKTKSGLSLVNQLIPRAKEHGDRQVSRRLQILKSGFLSRVGDLSSAEEAVYSCMEVTGWNEITTFAADAINNLGVILSMRGYWESAITQFNRSLSIFQQLGHRRGVGSVNHNLGMAFRHSNQFAIAESHFSRAYNYYFSKGIAEEHVFTQSERSIAVYGLGDHKRAEAMAERALDQCKMLGSKELLGEATRVLGTIYASSGKWEEARKMLRAAYRSANDLDNPQMKAEIYEEMAILEFNQGRDSVSKLYSEKAKNYYKKIGAGGREIQLDKRMLEIVGKNFGRENKI